VVTPEARASTIRKTDRPSWRGRTPGPRRAGRRALPDPALGVIYMLPALALLAFVYAYPIYRLARLSREQSLGSQTLDVGWLNYELVLDDPVFRTAVRNSVSLLACVPFMTAVGMLFALLLFEQTRARGLVLFLLMILFVTSIAVTGIAFANALTLNGALNETLDAIGLGALRQDWLGNPDLALSTVGAVIVWQQASFAVVIFYARLLSVPVQYTEAALLDGAGWWRRHWHVTLPQMRSAIALYVCYAAITILAWIFPYVFILTRGGPANATTTTDLYIYDNAFAGTQANLAGAAAMLLLAGTAALVVAFLVLRRAIRRGPR
jgi:ABC-type sugar transport system permease subunit